MQTELHASHPISIASHDAELRAGYTDKLIYTNPFQDNFQL